MAGFDESAIKRLSELVSRSRAGQKLPSVEALELKELKLLKSAAEIAKGRAEIAIAKRKIEDREKYRVGGLAVAAGLNVWSDDDLKAAFADLAARGRWPHTAHNGDELMAGLTENKTESYADAPAENTNDTEWPPNSSDPFMNPRHG